MSSPDRSELRPAINFVSVFVYFIPPPDVLIDPAVPIPQWRLSPRGMERMERIVNLGWVSNIDTIFCSMELKAVEGANILSRLCHAPMYQMAQLGENDRSATGYLPKKEFETTADEFFAKPLQNVRGWESASAAQARIVNAIQLAFEASQGSQKMAIVSHGGVGGLLLCHLKKCPISRAEDQPGSSGGNYFLFEMPGAVLVHGWKPVDAT